MRRVPDPPHVVVQRLTDAFNKQDLDAVSLCLAANCVVANHGGETVQVGAPAICAQYAAAFKVVQHEAVNRGLTSADRRIAIYTVAGEKVTRVEFLR